MKKSDFYFDLPEELIAQTPLQQRDQSRLMLLDKQSGAISHRHFFELPDLLREGDCLIMNDSRVLPARLLGSRLSGGSVELVLLRDLGDGRWECLSRPGRKTKPGTQLQFGDGELKATVEPMVLADKSVTWSSEDASVATVDENGVVTAVASGETKIIATSNATKTVSGYAVVKVPGGMDATIYAQVAFNDDVQFAAIDLNDMSTTNLSGTNVFSYFTGGAQSGGFIYGNDTDNDFHSYNAKTYAYDSFWHDIYEVIQAPLAMLDGASIPNFTYVVTDADGVETEVPFKVNVVGVCSAGYLLFYDEGGMETLSGFSLSDNGITPIAITFAGIGQNKDGTLYMIYYVLDKSGASRASRSAKTRPPTPWPTLAASPAMKVCSSPTAPPAPSTTSALPTSMIR